MNENAGTLRLLADQTPRIFYFLLPRAKGVLMGFYWCKL